MNKKIILLLVITCILSAIAIKTFAGTAGGSGFPGVGMNCSAGGNNTAGSITNVSMTANTAGFSTSSITLNVTCTNPATCYNVSSPNLTIINDTVLKSCDGRTKEYLAQNITGNFTNITFVQVNAASPQLVLVTANGRIYLLIFGVDLRTLLQTIEITSNYGWAEQTKFTTMPSTGKILKENDKVLISSLGGKTGTANYPMICKSIININTYQVEAADCRYTDVIPLGPGYKIDLGDPIATEKMNTGAIGDFSLDTFKVRSGTGTNYESYATSFKFDTLTNYVDNYNNRAIKIASPGVDNVITGGTQVYTTQFTNEGGGDYAYTLYTGYTSDGKTFGLRMTTDGYVTDGFTVQPADLATIKGWDATYIPLDKNGAVEIIATDTSAKKPYIIKIPDQTHPTIGIQIQQIASGITGDKCSIGTNPRTSELVGTCYDNSIRTASRFTATSTGTIAEKRVDKHVTSIEQAMLDLALWAAFSSTVTMYTGTNSSQILVYRSGSGSTYQSSVVESKFVGDSLAVLRTSTIAEGNTGSWIDFVAAGRSPNNRSILLGYFNTSMEAYAINPNGTMQFTTDKIVQIQTMSPDINILNFQLRWQNFSGTFDTTAGTCIGCTYDAMNTCQAEVEKVFGMYNNYNITINLTPDRNITMQNLQMCCRDLNRTIAKGPTGAGNCTSLTTYPASTYSTTGCFTPTTTTGYSYNTSDTVCIYLQRLNTSGIQIPIGRITPTSTCEQIACEINGTWNASNDQTFTINKSITVMAI